MSTKSQVKGTAGRSAAPSPRPIGRRATMIKWLKRRLCRHAYSWSERRQREVCARCGMPKDDSAA